MLFSDEASMFCVGDSCEKVLTYKEIIDRRNIEDNIKVVKHTINIFLLCLAATLLGNIRHLVGDERNLRCTLLYPF